MDKSGLEWLMLHRQRQDLSQVMLVGLFSCQLATEMLEKISFIRETLPKAFDEWQRKPLNTCKPKALMIHFDLH